MESTRVTAVPANMCRRASRRRTVGSRHVALVLTDACVRKVVVSAGHVRSDARQEQRKHERHRSRASGGHYTDRAVMRNWKLSILGSH